MLKTTLGVVAGMILGAGAMAFYQRHSDPGLPIRNALSPTPALEVANLQEKIATLEATLASQGKARAPLVVATERGEKIPKDRKPEGTAREVEGNHARELEKRQRQRHENWNAARLATLVQRLDLTPAQEEEVRTLLEAVDPNAPSSGGLIALSQDGSDLTLGLDVGGGKSENPADFDAALADLLDANQREAYAGLREEGKRNRVEAEANEELARLQRMLTLSDTQKDAAFEAFSEIARARQDGPGIDVSTLGSLRKDRVDALRGILTPEQAKVYEDTPQILTLGGAFAPAGATIHIESQIIPPPPEE